MLIPLSQFAPTADQTTPGIIVDATNIVPTLRGYAGAPTGADVGMDALAAAALSATIATKLDASNRLIAGTTTKLYEKSGTGWTDVSRVAAYNASTTYPWRFAQFGDTTLAVNKGDVIQSSATGAFADLTAPKAAVMCVVSGFVMLGNTNEATYGDSLNRWWCSAYLDETDWTPAISTQCTTGLLVDTPGAITAMKALGYDVVAYKADSMYLGRYSGPPGVWQWTLIPGEIGCASHEAVADIGGAHLFVGPDDIYLFNGGVPQAVGSAIREWFFADLDPTYKGVIRSSHDRTNSLVYFYYPRLGSGGSLTGCIVYNYKTGKWGVAHRSIECAVDYITGGYTYDTLPITTWDSWPAVAFDSPFWTASSKYTAYIGTDHKVYSLTGACDTSSITTGAYGTEDEYSLLKRVTLRFLERPTTATCTNYYQELLGDAWTEDATTTQSSGRFDLLRSSVWHKATFDMTGPYELTGFVADLAQDGVL